MTTSNSKTGLIMAGGGARAAYQIGVLRAIAELTPHGSPSPFGIVCGTSAGAINAAMLACQNHDFRMGVRRLLGTWSNFHVDQVFRADPAGILKTGGHWLLTMMSFGLLGRKDALYLLDRRPLEALLRRDFDPDELQKAIDAGHLHALSVTASGYTSHESVSFYQGNPDIKSWKRARRIGARARITVDHLVASSAIPFIFAPQAINREFFGDGSMRQIAPISPALHLGAERVLVIGNRHADSEAGQRVSNHSYPTFGEIAGHALNSIFLDSLEADIERLERINRTISLIPKIKREAFNIELREIEVLTILPSRDLGKLAIGHIHELPRTIRLLMRGIGASKKSGSSLVSYLLFEKGYCRELIKLGYKDARAKQRELRDFLEL